MAKGASRGLVARISAGYRDVRGSMVQVLADRPSEGGLLALILLVSVVGFLANLPDAAAQARAGGAETPLVGVLAGRLFAAIFLTPLAVYAVAALTHLIAKPLGASGDFYAARAALAWAMALALPLVVLDGVVGALTLGAASAGLGGVGLAVSAAAGIGFLWLWALCLTQAEGFASFRPGFAIISAIIFLPAALVVAFRG